MSSYVELIIDIMSGYSELDIVSLASPFLTALKSSETMSCSSELNFSDCVIFINQISWRHVVIFILSSSPRGNVIPWTHYGRLDYSNFHSNLMLDDRKIPNPWWLLFAKFYLLLKWGGGGIWTLIARHATDMLRGTNQLLKQAWLGVRRLSDS